MSDVINDLYDRMVDLTPDAENHEIAITGGPGKWNVEFVNTSTCVNIGESGAVYSISGPSIEDAMRSMVVHLRERNVREQ